jgi:hypothetical protein
MIYKGVFMKKLMFLLALGFQGIYCMEESTEPSTKSGIIKADIPEYRTYQGIEINAETIGSLVTSLPESQNSLVKEWRDNNKTLLAGLVDFTHKNSEWDTAFNNNLEALKDAGIDNKSKYSYIFALPTDKSLFVQIAGQLHRVRNLQQKGGICYVKPLKSPETDALEKCPTFQTISRFAYYLRFLETAKKNNFNSFTVPATYLIPLEDDQPLTEYSDDNCFVVQDRIPESCVTIREDKARISDANQQSFKELLAAIAPAAFWDLEPNLLIDDNNKLLLADIEQGNNANPDFFLHKNEYMFNHLACCGFKGIYNLCDQDAELQHQIQDFVRDNLHLVETQYYQDQEKDLHKHVKLIE